MSNTVKLPVCPKCHAPIPAEAPQGLCPRCVLLGAATDTNAGVPATATSEIPSLERIATAFPQLEVLELIGRGGMGFVFKARQPHLDRFVALKLLPDKLAKDALFAERFNREGRVLAKLNHPNIVSVYDFGQAGGFYYLAMEYVDGVNLRQAMRAGRFSPAEALTLVPKVCEALQYAHEQGILHRDIKPENILLDTKGRVKIADFGIAKLVGEDQPNITLTNTGAALGTPHYMAPEQFEKPATVDHRADIYSLGVVFYEMLTGELPIGRFAAPSSKTPVGTSVDEVVFRTLEKDRERRFQSAGEMRTEVEHLGKGTNAVPPAEAEKPAPAPPVLPPPSWINRAGVSFCVLGGTALVPTLLGIVKGEAIVHSHALLILTGVALLTRKPAFMGYAFFCNGLGLIAPLVFMIARALKYGSGPALTRMLGFTVEPPGIPDIWWLKVPLTILHLSTFAIGYWTLIRLGRSPWLRIDRHQASPPAHSRLNIAGAALVFQSLLPSLVKFVFFVSGQQSSSFSVSRMEIALMALPGLAGTLIGWLVLKRIRESSRPQEGLHLAMFSALAWPLILSVALAFRLMLSLLFDGRMASKHPMLGALCYLLAPLVIGIAFWMVRATKRWAAKENSPQERGWLKWSFIAVVIFLMAAVMTYAPTRRLVSGSLPSQVEPVAASPATTVELWSPKLAPGEKPKPSEILQEAARLVQEGQYEQALQRHLWYHHHALEFEPSQVGVRLSFALSQWMELARRYPPARVALIEIRDRDARQFSGRGGSFDLFMGISFINQAISEDYVTAALFKSVQGRNPKLARQCYPLAEHLLVEAGEYDRCAPFIQDAQERFDQIHTKWTSTLKAGERTPEASRALLGKEAQRVFIKETRTLVEILVGIRRKTEAEEIRDQAVALVDAPELRSAVADAEERVAKHSPVPRKP